MCEGDVFLGLVFCAQLGERLGAEDLRLRVGRVPGAEEDVVLRMLADTEALVSYTHLSVWRADVADFS